MRIAVEGLIGAGKSTLAELLAERYHAKILRQRFELHPLLQQYYYAPRSVALEKIMIFLYIDFYSLRESDDHGLVFCDFTFEKILAFGKLDLEERVFSELLMPSFKFLRELLPPTDLMLYLDTSPRTALQRIRGRAREMEVQIDIGYLQRLAKAYQWMLKNHSPRCPILNISGYNIKTRTGSSVVDRLMKRMEKALPALGDFRR